MLTKTDTATTVQTERRVRFVIRGAWQEGELVDAGCTWRIVRAATSGHRMLLPAADVREIERRDGKEAT